jgi:hypothetical protein
LVALKKRDLVEETRQKLPVEGREDVASAVIADINNRIDHGEMKYGKRLATFNGRDALLDLYEELLDAVVYAKQELLERAQTKQPKNARKSTKQSTRRS